MGGWAGWAGWAGWREMGRALGVAMWRRRGVALRRAGRRRCYARRLQAGMAAPHPAKPAASAVTAFSWWVCAVLGLGCCRRLCLCRRLRLCLSASRLCLSVGVSSLSVSASRLGLSVSASRLGLRLSPVCLPVSVCCLLPVSSRSVAVCLSPSVCHPWLSVTSPSAFHQHPRSSLPPPPTSPPLHLSTSTLLLPSTSTLLLHPPSPSRPPAIPATQLPCHPPTLPPSHPPTPHPSHPPPPPSLPLLLPGTPCNSYKLALINFSLNPQIASAFSGSVVCAHTRSTDICEIRPERTREILTQPARQPPTAHRAHRAHSATPFVPS